MAGQYGNNNHASCEECIIIFDIQREEFHAISHPGEKCDSQFNDMHVNYGTVMQHFLQWLSSNNAVLVRPYNLIWRIGLKSVREY